VRRLKLLCPIMGKVRIAQVLARAGLHLAPRTARRLLDRPRCPEPDPEPGVAKSTQRAGHGVIARYPNHVWSIDHTVVPTRAGFWISWIPSSVAPRWPFCHWVSIVLDHFSRRVMGFSVFDREPSAAQICSMLDVAVVQAGRAPKYTVTDQGVQFGEKYVDWCACNGVKPRYGAVGERGSIAKIERFMGTLKQEYFRRIVVPYAMAAMHEHAVKFVMWYGEHRPHQGLGGATPNEVYFGRKPACTGSRFEPRARYPAGRCQRRRGVRLKLLVSHLNDTGELPIVELQRAA
jgi:transposase InsO family protein